MSSVKRKVEVETERRTKPKNEESDLLKELEERIENSSSVKDVLSDKRLAELTDDERQLRNRLFLAAVKDEKIVSVDFFIKKGVDVYCTDEGGNSAADYAWTKRNWKILLTLLESDSFFPKHFNFNELNEQDECLKVIINLVIERNKLHEAIITGSVNDVINLNFQKNSKLYLSDTNHSAAFVAIRNRKFDIYAYLKSIGAEFGKKAEESALKILDDTDKGVLQEAMTKRFFPVPNSHIFYLVSKSRSQKLVMDLNEKLRSYYEKLDEIPEVSLILKVIQFADYLDIVFDFEKDHVSTICPTVAATRKSRGETVHKLGRIYVAAGLEEEEVLGTVGHELTHMAMQMLYENECNPYWNTDAVRKTFFENLKKFININFKRSGNESGPLKVLLNAMDNYSPVEQDAELIVRIPHILIQFEDGRDWINENVSELFKFFKDEIENKCEKFINQSLFLKPRSIVKSINESIGELPKIRTDKIFFENVSKFESDGTQVFMVNVKNTFLGILKVLQGIYGKSYINFYHDFLVLKIQNLIKHRSDVLQVFLLDGSDWLIIEVSEKPLDYDLNKCFEQLSELLSKKSNKRVVLITQEGLFDSVWKKVEKKIWKPLRKKISESEPSLDSLDFNSQLKILKNNISFQGNPMTLEELINNRKAYKFVDSGIIETLLLDRTPNIGNDLLGLTDLEGCYYSDLVSDVDSASLVREIENSNGDYFIMRINSTDELKYLIDIFDDEPVNTEFLKRNVWDFKGSNIAEKIIFVNDRFRDEDFKCFCKNHSKGKCYFISVENLKVPKFHLKLIYDSDFYVRRRIKKVILESEELFDKAYSETFIITKDGNEGNALQEHDNLKLLSSSEAKHDFIKLSKPGKTVHWFSLEKGQFIWKNSHGDVTTLRQYVFRNETETKTGVIEEDYLILEIRDRKVLLIADSPGMGKTTTLTKLYENKSIRDVHWIIKLNLKDQLEPIRSRISGVELKIEIILQFLQQIYPILKEDSNEILLTAALTTENAISKCLLIVFDGFDELLDKKDRDTVINLFKFLKNETVCKIWVTSRLQYKEELENCLETLAMEFYPLNNKTKKLFVSKYLKGRLNLILDQKTSITVFSKEENSKISIFTKELLLKMNDIFKEDTEKFIGTPLQLNLVMIGSAENFTSWTKRDKAALNLNYLGKDFLQVYENFIEKKYQVYFKKSNLKEETHLEDNKTKSENFNRDLAESLIYKRKTLKPKSDTDKKIILLIGLVQSQNKENFEFIHFTFREFYYAKIVPKCLLNKKTKKKLNFIFADIFIKKEFELIRKFLNIIIQNEKPSEKLKAKISNDGVMEPYTTFDSILAIAAEEGHTNLFKFFYFTCKHMPNFETTKILNRTFFYYATTGEKIQTWEMIFDILKKEEIKTEWERFYLQCLIYESACFAAENNFESLALFIILKIENFTISEKRNFLNFAKKRQTLRKILEMQDSTGIFQLLLKMVGDVLVKEEQHEYLIDPNRNDPYGLFSAARKNDPKFMELLFVKSDEILDDEEKRQMMRDKTDETILHMAALHGRMETAKLIWERAEKMFKFEKCEFIMDLNKENKTVFHCAVEQIRKIKKLASKFGKIRVVETLVPRSYVEVTKFLMEEAEKKLPIDEFKKCMKIADKSKKTILHLVLEKGSFELVKLVFENSLKILKEDLQKWIMAKEPDVFESILITACRRNDVKILAFVIGKAEEILTSREEVKMFLMSKKSNRNALHFILDKNNLEMLKLLLHKFDECMSEDDQIQLLMTEGSFLVAAASHWKPDIFKFLLQEKEALLTKALAPHSREVWRILYSILYNGSADVVKSVWDKLEKCLPPADRDQLLETSFEHFLQAVTSNENSENVTKVFDIMGKNFSKDKRIELLKEKTTKEIVYINNALCTDLTYLHLVNSNHSFHIDDSCNVADIMKSFLDEMGRTLTRDELFQLLMYKPKTPSMENGRTVLHVVTNDKESEQLKLILQKMGEILSTEQQRKLLMETDESNGNVLNLTPFAVDPIKAADLILTKAGDVLTEEEFLKFWMNQRAEKTVFHEAVECRKVDLLRFLMKKSNNILKLENKVELMTKNTALLSSQIVQNSILHAAAFRAEPEILKLLLEYMSENFEIPKQREILMMKIRENQTPLHLILSSSKYINQEAVAILLEKMEKALTASDWIQLITVKDENIYTSILYAAALNTKAEIVKLILDIGEKYLKFEFSQLFALKDKKFGSVLHAAVLNKDPKVVKVVLAKGREILTKEQSCELLTVTNKNGRTVLHLAASNDEPLLERGTEDFTATESNHEDQSYKDRSEFVYLFLKEAEGVMNDDQRLQFLNMKDEGGKSALHVAVETEKIETVKLLLRSGEKLCSSGEDLKDLIMKQNCDRSDLERSFCTDNFFIANLLTFFMGTKNH